MTVKRGNKKSKKGGDFLGDLKKVGQEADKILRKTKVISRGLDAAAPIAGNILKNTPHPYAQIAGQFAEPVIRGASGIVSSYGYGKQRYNYKVGGGATKTVKNNIIYY